jgi:zinc protease
LPFEDLIAKLTPYMEKWPSQTINLALPEPVKKEWSPSLQGIDRPVNQSSIILGHFGDKRFNPDKFSIILANQILGLSTFGSRLGTKIRTDLGLAYSVYSNFDLETDIGAFQIVARTKSSSTFELINETRKLLEAALTEQPFTQEELDNAKQTILNQLIFKYSDPFEVVQDRARYDFYGYPPDYLTVYQRAIRETSLDQVQSALKKYFFPDQLKILIVGDLKAIGNRTELGKIEKLPLDND